MSRSSRSESAREESHWDKQASKHGKKRRHEIRERQEDVNLQNIQNIDFNVENLEDIFDEDDEQN